jgi:hypothetical protein
MSGIAVLSINTVFRSWMVEQTAPATCNKKGPARARSRTRARPFPARELVTGG